MAALAVGGPLILVGYALSLWFSRGLWLRSLCLVLSERMATLVDAKNLPSVTHVHLSIDDTYFRHRAAERLAIHRRGRVL